MTNLTSTICIILLLSISWVSWAQGSSSPRIIPVADPNNILLTFGSCNCFFGDEPNDIFYRAEELNPDVWVWLGDVAYLDLRGYPPFFGFNGEQEIKRRLSHAKNQPPYAHLRKNTTVVGVWDDHDYGRNNAGKTFPHKVLMQQLWLDFVDEPKDSLRRKQKGIYESYYLGGPDKVKIILTDGRYFKDDHASLPSGNKGKDILGEKQWAWLENELKDNKAKYTVIGAGIQVLPDDRYLPETWFTQSRDRLINLIKKYQVGGVLLISGDVHYAEIMKHPCKERVGFDLYEFTSSGITHHVTSHIPAPADRLIASVYPNTFNEAQDKFFERNFGAIRFYFGEKGGVKLEARSYYGDVVLEKYISSAELEFNADILDEKSTCILDLSEGVRFWNNFKVLASSGSRDGYIALFCLLFVLIIIIKTIQSLFGIIFRIVRFGVGLYKVSSANRDWDGDRIKRD